MLQLTLTDGRTVQRVFAGFITTEDDLERVVNEMRGEIHESKGQPLMVELWLTVKPRKRGDHLPLASTNGRSKK